MDRRLFLATLASVLVAPDKPPKPKHKPKDKGLMRPTIVGGACVTASAYNASLTVSLPSGTEVYTVAQFWRR